MQGTNPTEFEKWCADEMGHTVEYMIMQRKINTLGMLQYRNAEIEKRFMAYKAGLISGASIGCESAKVQGTNWVKCSDSLPDMETPVFAGWFWNGKFVWHVFMRSDSGFEGWIWSRSYSHFISDNDEFIEDDNYPITHWMPLLLPPMPEGE